jgi:hypothetical protein
MLESAERIRHYHKLLLQQHRFVGGTVLHGYQLSTRAFEWRAHQAYRTWGADYTPTVTGPAWLERRLIGEGYDEELGTPGIQEGWLSVARKMGQAATAVTKYEYGAGMLRGMAPYVAVRESRIEVPFNELRIDHVRGGMGFWRGDFNFPTTTTDPSHADQLANALQSAAVHVIKQSD